MDNNQDNITVIAHSFAKALPTRKVTNDDLAKIIDTSDEWIKQRTGIQSRFWVEPPMTTSDLAVLAGQQTLENSKSNEVDAIIAATLSPDHCFPGIGVQIQNKLKLTTIPAFDIRNQCSGFLYGLELATALIKSNKYNRILLIGAEVHSTALDITTRGRNIAVLFRETMGRKLHC